MQASMESTDTETGLHGNRIALTACPDSHSPEFNSPKHAQLGCANGYSRNAGQKCDLGGGRNLEMRENPPIGKGCKKWQKVTKFGNSRIARFGVIFYSNA
jgi:hypothetical protein